MNNVTWTELPDGAPEPDAPAILLDVEGTGWVRPKIPGRPDAWYRIGGGRGESSLLWENLSGPVFLAGSEPPDAVQAVVEVAYDVAERMGWAAGPAAPSVAVARG